MSKSNLSVGTKAWADKINAASRQSAFDIGGILLKAKDAMPHGDFEKMIRSDLDFSPQTARKLMAIAGDQRLTNRAPGRALPQGWTTQYELTKLDDETLERAWESGVITPTMRRADVPRKRKESPQGDAVPAVGEREANQEPPQTVAKSEDSAVDFWHGEKVAAETGDDVRYEDAPEAEGDPASRFAMALTAALAVSCELSPREAVEAWPENISLQALREFTSWLLDCEDALGNIVLQSAVAE